MTNDEILMTNQWPNDLMTKSATGDNLVIGASSLIGHSCLDISHYPVIPHFHHE